MIKDYRKRFVQSIMLLTGLALLLTFIVLGVVIYRNEFSRLKSTMSLVISPWESPGDNFRTLGSRGSEDSENNFAHEGQMQPPEESFPEGKPMQDPGSDGAHPHFDGNGPMARRAALSEDIATIIYNKESGAISILSQSALGGSDDISDAVKEISGLSEEFGLLRSYGLIYYKEDMENTSKIALASVSYIGSKMIRTALMLVGAYIVVMVLMFFISRRLAKTAAKPMEDAVEMERQFVADISHDLKTPITVVMANSSILRDSKSSTVEDQMQWIDSTDEAARSMLTLVTEMLDLSSLESAGRTANKENVDLSALAEKCELQMESVAFERGVELESDIEEGITVTADKELTQRIFSGLIENALKYEPLGGRVDVMLKRVKRKAVFSVINHGSSIAEEDIPHIFERFYRGDKSRGEKKGYGLGLPIIKAMADLMGAKISASSSPSEGTVFTVEFE